MDSRDNGRENGNYRGYNGDYIGFYMDVKREAAIKDCSVMRAQLHKFRHLQAVDNLRPHAETVEGGITTAIKHSLKPKEQQTVRIAR